MSDLQVKLMHSYATGFRINLDTRLPLQGVTALFGPSGSGKTTILNTLAGLGETLDSASVICGDVIWQNSAQRLPPWRRPVAYVFQEPRLFPHLSVAANLDYGYKHVRQHKVSVEQVVQWLGLDNLLARKPQELSSGQQQRVAIGRALLASPQLLLLDEPLANLDRPAAADILRRLQRVSRETALPMIYVSHHIEEVCAIADQLILLEQGEIQAQGPLLELAGRLDTRLAEDESAAAVLVVDAQERDDNFQLTRFQADGQSLWVGAEDSAQPRRRLRIPARDVSVCRERPTQSSILNILETELVAIRELSPAHCLLQLRLQEQYLLSRITCRSRAELKLQPGDRLYAQIKSTALLSDGQQP